MKNVNDISKENVLFFDMDGTLVDTNLANFLSYKKAIEHVKKVDLKIIYDPAIRFNRSLLKIILPTLKEDESEMIIHEKEKCYNDFLKETQLIKENTDILNKYYKTNKTVLVTNCLEKRALATLNHHNLTDKFANLFFQQSEREVRFNKFQYAISTLDISPKLVIAFENDDKEIANAENAGIHHINLIIK